MATELRLRSGTTAEHATFTGAASEVTVDTDKNAIIVHDGTTAGGHETALVANTIEKTADTGSAVLPVGDDSERDASPSAGYLRWNTDQGSAEIYDGSVWGAVGGGGGATGGGSDDIFYENSQTVTTDYTISTGKNAMSTGPLTINSGVTITIPSGSVWKII